MSNARGPRPGQPQMSLFDVTEPEPVIAVEAVETLTAIEAAPAIAPTPAIVPPPVEAPRPAPDADADARAYAVDPRHNVVLEASAGTGKTSVLVWRYINLLKAGVEPGNILAITFTRKAATEMRERIIHELRLAAARSEIDKARWIDLRDRIAEIDISTIDAFCLSLLREFPLEADLDPGFEMADETEVPRLIEDALDRSLRIFGGLAKHEPDVAMVLAQLGVNRTREGLASLLDRRLVAWDALNRFLVKGPSDLTGDVVCRRAATALQDALRTAPEGLARFITDGPIHHPRYQLLANELQRLGGLDRATDAQFRALLDRVAAHFLTGDYRVRKTSAIYPYKADHYPSAEAGKRHRAAVTQLAPQIERIRAAFVRDLNVVLARGVRRMFAIALTQYRKALEERSVLDFSDVLQRALDLLRQMDEFSQSRFRLESRYHHVLVDEFQDTSRAQWELVSLLIQSWREGLGVATEPSIFIVGDRKQSIYRFRDAEVAVLREAGRHIDALRPASSAWRSISRSFRAVPDLLQFVNDLFTAMSQPGTRSDDFTYGETDRFPVTLAPDTDRGPVLGIVPGSDPVACGGAVADEIARILREDSVRDRTTGVARPARPGDIAILFRSRASHREFEHELGVRRIPAYVYKGLGFFDADEIKDLTALIRYLANPGSDLRASALLRSRFVRLSDRGLAALTPRFASALTDAEPPPALLALEVEDRLVLTHVRSQIGGWLASADRIPPADLIEQLLPATAYAYELRGPRRLQAWENIKKMRGLVRRIQNRGYATLTRIADHIDALTAGDESNAVLEALDAVNLMTIHAAKGLEFPIVFVVNVAKGASGPPRPIRVVADGEAGEPSVSVGPFVSDTDEAEREREKQETRRLLYVACTRARDRLYFSAALKDGVLQAGRGSLAEVLPVSVTPLFAAASVLTDTDTIEWTGPSGRTFAWRICRPAPPDVAAAETTTEAPGTARDDLAPPRQVGSQSDRFEALLEPAGLRRASVTAWLEDEGEALETVSVATSQDLMTGTLVHRLFQHGGEPHEDDLAVARGLLRPDEYLHATDGTVPRAVACWRAMRARADVSALFDGGRRLHEVPFSLRLEDGAILRGTIDCLVEREDGTVVVIELKTGRPRDSHQRQLDLYVRAAQALYPSATVSGLLVY